MRELSKRIISYAPKLLTVVFIVSFFGAVSAHADTVVTITVPDDYTAGEFTIELDGVPQPADPATHPYYPVTVRANCRFITAIRYNGAISNASSYPIHMAVWEINEIGGVISAQRVPGMDDILGYSGFAIRPPSTNVRSGFRCTLTVPKTIRDNGVTDGEDVLYQVQEYGHLHIFSRNWSEASRYNMTVNDMLVQKAFCYKRETGADYKIKEEGGKIYFANSLYGIVDYDVEKHFRGYMRLHKVSTNSDVYLYGPIVGRNPYFVARALKDDASRYNASSLAMRNYVDEIVTGVESTPAPTKRALFIGDSIMIGMTPRNGSYVQVSDQPSKVLGAALADKLGATVSCTLLANGGTTYSEPGANHVSGRPSNMPMLADAAVSSIPAAQSPDYIFLLAGVNDWGYQDQGERGPDGELAVFGAHDGGHVLFATANPEAGYPAQEYTDEHQSYMIGIDRTLIKLMNAYPGAKILVCSPLRAYWNGYSGSNRANASTGKTLSDYVHVQGVIANYYRSAPRNKNVFWINLYDGMLEPMGLSGEVPEGLPEFLNYFPDGYHPSQRGYNVMCSEIIDQMEDLGLFE